MNVVAASVAVGGWGHMCCCCTSLVSWLPGCWVSAGTTVIPVQNDFSRNCSVVCLHINCTFVSSQIPNIVTGVTLFGL